MGECGMGEWNSTPLSRRGLLLATGALGVSRWVSAGDEPASPDVEAVRKRAEEMGLGTLKTSESDRYVVLGDAPEAFRAAAKNICDGVAADFLRVFKAKGFAVERPKSKMVVVVLSGPEEFAKFLGVPQEEATGGIYDLETNRLVIFDNRAREDAGPNVARANTVALTHEATHQLCFNTGLLSRAADIPLTISEGLALYAEIRSPNGKPTKLGDLNRYRLQDLTRAGQPWIPLQELLTKDSLFDDPQTRGIADAESWLLTYYHMSTKERVPAFRAYLSALSTRRDATHRREDAESKLGDLEALDKRLKWSSRTLSGY
jgi:hypothetical protein